MIASQTEPRIKHLYHLTGARFVSNIRYAVKQLVPADQVDDTVNGIVALIDGFFWQIARDYEEGDLGKCPKNLLALRLLVDPRYQSIGHA